MNLSGVARLHFLLFQAKLSEALPESAVSLWYGVVFLYGNFSAVSYTKNESAKWCASVNKDAHSTL